jgi:hypothetical protein
MFRMCNTTLICTVSDLFAPPLSSVTPISNPPIATSNPSSAAAMSLAEARQVDGLVVAACLVGRLVAAGLQVQIVVPVRGRVAD